MNLNQVGLEFPLDPKELEIPDNIWRFTYTLDQREGLIECGGFYIAVDGVTGNLLKVWVEE